MRASGPWALCTVVQNGETVAPVLAASEEGSMYIALLMYDTATQLFVNYPTDTSKLAAAIKASAPMWDKAAA